MCSSNARAWSLGVGSEMESVSPIEITLLHVAASTGNAWLVELMLEKGPWSVNEEWFHSATQSRSKPGIDSRSFLFLSRRDHGPGEESGSEH